MARDPEPQQPTETFEQQARETFQRSYDQVEVSRPMLANPTDIAPPTDLPIISQSTGEVISGGEGGTDSGKS
jgi:hypothetical protein